ncbi:bacterial Ig-like domain family protein, partial [Cloacibacterium normanense]
IATVSNTGLVTGVAAGSVTITYTNNNGCSTTTTVTVNPLPTITGTTSVCVGSTTQLTGSGTPAASNPWTSSNTA